MSKYPKPIKTAWGGLSSSEMDGLGESTFGRPSLDFMPSLDQRSPTTIFHTTAAIGLFAGNTRLAPFTGTGVVKVRDPGGLLVGVGSGGPCGIGVCNTGSSDLVYQGFTTAYDTAGGHVGGNEIKVVLRTGAKITLGANTSYTVVIYPNVAMNSTGRFLPPPKDLAGCYQFIVEGSDIGGYAGATYTGVANVSPFIALKTGPVVPSKVGYAGLALTAGGGDLVFIYPTIPQGLVGDDEHELVWSASAAFVGPRAIWHPYQTLQRKTTLSNGAQLVQVAGPCASAAINTDENYYQKPTFQLAPEQMLNGQRWNMQLNGDMSGAGGGVKYLEVLVFLGPGEENGWDPAGNNWFNPGPYLAIAGGTWVEATKTLTVVGSGIGNLGAAALWVTSGTNAVLKPYLISGGAGDSITLYTSLQSGGAASAIVGYVGGFAYDIGNNTILVGGELKTTAVLAFQSPCWIPTASKLLKVELEVSGAGGQSIRGQCRFTLAGGSGAQGGLTPLPQSNMLNDNDPIFDVVRQCTIAPAIARVDLVNEHCGFTVLYKLGDGGPNGEVLVPGVHYWYSGQAYDPLIGLGSPLKFFQTTNPYDTVTLLNAYSQDGSIRARVGQAGCAYMGAGAP